MNEYQIQEQLLPQYLTAKRKIPKSVIVGIVCGILSFFGFGLFGLFIVGIIAGFLALSKIKKSDGILDGKNLATAGLILNGLSALFTIVF